jgi:hypothetical protein
MLSLVANLNKGFRENGDRDHEVTQIKAYHMLPNNEQR